MTLGLIIIGLLYVALILTILAWQHDVKTIKNRYRKELSRLRVLAERNRQKSFQIKQKTKKKSLK